MTAADILVERLGAWGVEVVFGLPGSGIGGLVEALRRRRERIRFLCMRHEESAALAACAYAKHTGRLGVCAATSGAGAIHLLNGLYDAKLDGAPVLALTGTPAHDLMGARFQQEIDTPLLFQDVALYNERVTHPEHPRSLVDAACRAALAGRGVAHVAIPADIQWQPAAEAPRHRPMPGAGALARRQVVPPAEQMAAAAEALNRGERVAILCGQGALGATDEVLRLSDRLGAPIAKALLGKAAVPDDHPNCLGGIGLCGTHPAMDALAECDTLLVVGSSTPYLVYLPLRPGIRVVQVDEDPSRIGLRLPVEVGLVGDAQASLRALEPLVETRKDRQYLDRCRERMEKWRRGLDARAASGSRPLKPQAAVRALSEVLPDNAIVSADSGTVTVWAAQHFCLRRGQGFSLSGTLASMACAVPYAIAAKVAFPERASVALMGDGGFSMLMGEFSTAVQHSLPIVVMVLSNGCLGQVRWEQRRYRGTPEYAAELPPIDLPKVAEACGGLGLRAEDEQGVRSALEEALSAGRPALVEVAVDPDEPPPPPWRPAHDTNRILRGIKRRLAGQL